MTEEQVQDHSGHDHSGHDHSGHDHSGHDHAAPGAAVGAPPAGASPVGAPPPSADMFPNEAPKGVVFPEIADGEQPTPEQIREVLWYVEDPELRMSIVDLGLVYFIDIDNAGYVTIDLTLTTPACPIGPMLQGQIYHLLTQIDGVEDVEVNLVWDPPWDPRTMASEEVKLMLGVW